MAIAFTNKAQGTAGAGSGTATDAFDCTGADILYAEIFTNSAAHIDVVTDVSYNSVAMTRVGIQDEGGAGQGNSYLYRLVAPTTGSNNVVTTFGIGCTFRALVYTCYSGSKQSGGVFVSGTNQGATSASVTIVPNSANNWIVMAVGAAGNAPTATDSAFLRQVGSNVAITAFDTNAAVTGSTVMGASSNASTYAVAESFEPAGAAGTTLPFRALLGVGI